MVKASVRDLRYRFQKIEDLLREGKEVQITKRRRVIATLLPSAKAAPTRKPEFLARLKKLYGNHTLATTGAELIARDRNRF